MISIKEACNTVRLKVERSSDFAARGPALLALLPQPTNDATTTRTSPTNAEELAATATHAAVLVLFVGTSSCAAKRFQGSLSAFLAILLFSVHILAMGSSF
jgi:hypothetical protein